MLDLLTLLEFVNKVSVQFTLDFFKGSVILRSTHVCKECWVITFETWKTPYICNWEIPRCECYYPGTLAKHVINLLFSI